MLEHVEIVYKYEGVVYLDWYSQKMLKALKTLRICNIKSIWWTKLKKTAMFEKKIIHKVLDQLKSNFNHKYLGKEKRFRYAVFFCWSVLLSSTFWAKMSQNGWVVFELGRKNLFFWYKIAYKKKLGFFFEKRALSLFCLYHWLTSCKELERSLEPFSRKTIH